MKLIVGLGNPGKAYRQHRHNIGFMVADALAGRAGVNAEDRIFGAFIGKGKLDGEGAIFVKPQTFMNLSGDAVGPIAGFYKIPVEDIVVIHDDIDIDLGRLKLGQAQGHGGHNGVRSIIDVLGDNNFMRVRVGVGRPPEGMDAADYVLAPFSLEEEGAAEKMIEEAADATAMIVKEGLTAAQQRYN